MRTETIVFQGRTFEVRPLGAEFEWREVGHGWRVVSSEANAYIAIGIRVALDNYNRKERAS